MLPRIFSCNAALQKTSLDPMGQRIYPKILGVYPLQVRPLRKERTAMKRGNPMSAFLCTDEHTKALAIYWATGDKYSSGRFDREKIQEVADTLFNENVRSVVTRYPDCTPDNLPGPIDPRVPIVSTNDMLNPKVKDPVHILKLARSLDYQSCETGDWRETKAYDLLQDITNIAISNLPGYDAAPWEI